MSMGFRRMPMGFRRKPIILISYPRAPLSLLHIFWNGTGKEGDLQHARGGVEEMVLSSTQNHFVLICAVFELMLVAISSFVPF